MSSRVAVIGSLNVDLTVGVERHPRPGETVLGNGGEVVPGGKGGNQALAAARQGAETVMIGAVGSDPHADIATRLLRQEGVDLSHVSVLPGPTGLAIVAVDSSGENNIIVVPGANAGVTPDRIAAAEDTLAACAVTVIQGEIPAETISFASESLSRLGVRQILNLAPVLDLPPSVIGRSDPLIVNEHEAAQILTEAGGRAVSLTSTEAGYGQELAAALVESGIKSVVVTLGSAGAVLATSGFSVHIDAPKVEAVDTTGAGDAFVGALAASLARGGDLQSACELAVRVAAFSVRRRGAQESYPAASEALPY
jgi:ribokinase